MILDFDYGYFEHRELLYIFFQANDLEGIFLQDDRVIQGEKHTFLIIIVPSRESEMNLTFLALKHAGIKNMLDDYLIKCGKSKLVPDSYRF